MALRPDLVLCAGPVGRLAQELLRARGVGLLLGLGRARLDRIARVSGATVRGCGAAGLRF